MENTYYGLFLTSQTRMRESHFPLGLPLACSAEHAGTTMCNISNACKLSKLLP